MVIWKQLRNIGLAIPEELLAMVDEAAKARFMSRSEYIRYVLYNETKDLDSTDRLHKGPTDRRWLDVDDS